MALCYRVTGQRSINLLPLNPLLKSALADFIHYWFQSRFFVTSNSHRNFGWFKQERNLSEDWRTRLEVCVSRNDTQNHAVESVQWRSSSCPCWAVNYIPACTVDKSRQCSSNWFHGCCCCCHPSPECILYSPCFVASLVPYSKFKAGAFHWCGVSHMPRSSCKRGWESSLSPKFEGFSNPPMQVVYC